MTYKYFLETLKKNDLLLKDFCLITNVPINTIYNSWKNTEIPRWVSLLFDDKSFFEKYNNKNLFIPANIYDIFGNKSNFSIPENKIYTTLFIGEKSAVFMRNIINAAHNNKPFLYCSKTKLNIDLYNNENIEIIDFQDKQFSTARLKDSKQSIFYKNNLKELDVAQCIREGKSIIIIIPKHSLNINFYYESIINEIKESMVELLSFNPDIDIVKRQKREKYYIFMDGFINKNTNNETINLTENILAQSRSLNISFINNIESLNELNNFSDIQLQRFFGNISTYFILKSKSFKNNSGRILNKLNYIYSNSLSKEIKELKENNFIYINKFTEEFKGGVF